MKLEKVLKSKSDDVSPPLAIGNTQNERKHPGVLHETSLGNRLSKLKKANNFFKREERINGDIFWKNKPFENLGDSTLKKERRCF